MNVEKQAPMTRPSAITWARDVVSDPNAVYLDTETTGKSRFDRICDIAIIDQTGTVLFESLVNPGRPIPTEAAAIHGITDEIVADAPTWVDIADKVVDLLSDRTVVIYNCGYDEPIIQEHQKEARFFQIPANWMCAMLAYSDYDGTMNDWGKPKWHKLDAAAAHFGIAPGGHRARADAETTRLMVHAMALEGGPIDAGTFVQLPPAESPVTKPFISNWDESELMVPVETLAEIEAQGWDNTTDNTLTLEENFALLAIELERQEDAEFQIKRLRSDIESLLIADGCTSAESTTTNLVARIDLISRMAVNDGDQLIEWAKSDATGRFFLTETIDKKSLGDAIKRRGIKVPGVEMVTDERLVITTKKGAK
jgi:DNA polymerase-3 subunit epsilon